MKNKYKYLLKNVGLLLISNFGSKILSFILIPIYTSILSTSEYGTYDLYNTTVALLVPIFTLNIVEAVMRFSLEKHNDRASIFTIGLKYFLSATVIVAILCITNKIFNIIPIFNTYFIYFILLFFSQVLYDLLSQFSRGIEQVNKVAIAGFINSISIITINILMLVVLKTGLDGYFWANILGCIIPSIYLIISLKIWNYIDFKKHKTNEKEMTTYSKPLIFNTISWWITNVSDRYIVTWICGVAANGIYSIAYKIPSILNVCQTIFNQAWTISAVKEFDQKNSAFYINIYNLYNCFMVIVCSLLIIFNKLIAALLFEKEFYTAWIFAPFLMISVVFGAMSGLMGGIFCASKDSKMFAKTTLVGATINIIFNYILVRIYGPIGAAISTLLSYVVVWLLRYIKTRKIINFNINIKRDIVAYIVLLIQAITLYLKFKYIYLTECILFIIILILYYKEIFEIIKTILQKIKIKTI